METIYVANETRTTWHPVTERGDCSKSQIQNWITIINPQNCSWMYDFLFLKRKKYDGIMPWVGRARDHLGTKMPKFYIN